MPPSPTSSPSSSIFSGHTHTEDEYTIIAVLGFFGFYGNTGVRFGKRDGALPNDLKRVGNLVLFHRIVIHMTDDAVQKFGFLPLPDRFSESTANGLAFIKVAVPQVAQ